MSKVFRNKSEKIYVYAPGVIRKGNSVPPHQTSNATLQHCNLVTRVFPRFGLLQFACFNCEF